METLIVKGSYDKVIEWLDSSGRSPSKKCKSEDVSTEENDEPHENMESHSPVKGSSKMVQSHPRDKVIEWLDSSGRSPSKKCKSEDVSTEENDEPRENMESHSPVKGSSKMVQSHPRAITEALKQLVLEEKI